ncbi:MAG: hypothetical protein Q4A82_01090 [Corynebacterium sp.]|nr:hypothetical protein [Corynebacterium sp.]
MSQNANPTLAHVWLDGDAFRGVAGIAMPTDPFAETIANMDAFGGIEAGFEPSAEQSVDKKKVWNYRKAAYKVTRDPLSEGLKFRCLDNNKAVALTRAQGGKITEKNGLYLLEKGVGEEFSLLVRFDDGAEKAGIWCDRVTLAGPATRTGIDGSNIDGWEFDIAFLSVPMEIMPALPSGITLTP